MKKSYLILSILCSVFLNLQTQCVHKEQDSIVFDKLIHDLGTIEQGGERDLEFKFTNKGKSPLLLSDVQTSCGCAVPEWPSEPIEPGSTRSIKVRYHASVLGSFTKTIIISSNARNSEVLLSIQGTVIAN